MLVGPWKVGKVMVAGGVKGSRCKSVAATGGKPEGVGFDGGVVVSRCCWSNRGDCDRRPRLAGELLRRERAVALGDWGGCADALGREGDVDLGK